MMRKLVVPLSLVVCVAMVVIVVYPIEGITGVVWFLILSVPASLFFIGFLVFFTRIVVGSLWLKMPPPDFRFWARRFRQRIQLWSLPSEIKRTKPPMLIGIAYPKEVWKNTTEILKLTLHRMSIQNNGPPSGPLKIRWWHRFI